MPTSLPFIKMQGLGNDFIVVDGVLCKPAEFATQKKIVTPEFAKKICGRRFGVGADQVLWIRPAQAKNAVARMDVLNADGSTAEMCGNGIRAVALYLDRSLPKSKRKTSYVIETGSGLLSVEIKGDNARVDMGSPRIKPATELKLADGTSIIYTDVNMGNPHAVVFVDDPWKYPVERRGAEIEKHHHFPNRTNVEFAHPAGQKVLDLRVWERGSGMTMACGTGACAAAVAAISSGRCKAQVEVKLPGGSLQIEWNGARSIKPEPVFMSGPAEEVFRGEWQG